MVRVAGERRVHKALGLVVAVLSIALLGGVGAASAHGFDRGGGPTITVLSGRADLVSGGDALVSIGGLRSSRGAQRQGGRQGSDDRPSRPARDGTLVGLVSGLPLGTELGGRACRRRAAKLRVTNHPIGGPVFSGPQLQPWKCQATAQSTRSATSRRRSATSTSRPTRRSRASSPTTRRTRPRTSRRRRPTGRDACRSSCASRPATSTATSTRSPPSSSRASRGRRVAPQRAVQPQAADHARRVVRRRPPDGHRAGGDRRRRPRPALGARASRRCRHALDNAGHNCNLATEAESLMMAKEHLIERYGTLRYTIGTGCSGGSLAQQWIANAYPGIYQGILPTCSFPDAWSTATQFLDYHLTLALLREPVEVGRGRRVDADADGGRRGPRRRSPTRRSATPRSSTSSIPTDPCAGDHRASSATTRRPTPAACAARSRTRRSTSSARARSGCWSPQEKQIGRGFAGMPVDNVGVQYGLGALRSGKITPAQFVDLNAKIGGLDVDAEPTPDGSHAATRPALANAYRSGMINEANNLDRTAIIDCRGPDPGAFHDAYRAFAVRARLDREHGGHANQLIWEGPVALIARHAVRAQQLPGDGPLARAPSRSDQLEELARAEDRARQARGPHRPLLRRQRRRRSRTASARSRGPRLRHAAHGRRRRDHDRHTTSASSSR